MKKATIYYTDGGALKSGETGWGVYAIELDLEDDSKKELKGYLSMSGYPTDKQECHFSEMNFHTTFLNHYKIISERRIYGGILDATNNVGEIHAMQVALKDAIEKKETHHAVLITDSSYGVLGLVKHCHRWKAMNWTMLSTGKPPKNLDYWKRLEELWGKLEYISVFWTKGHNGNIGNDESDRLATRGIAAIQKAGGERSITLEEGIEQEEETVPKAKRAKKLKYDRLLPRHSWYFRAGKLPTTHEDWTIYTLGNHGPEDHKIRPDQSSNTAAAYFTKVPEPALESIRSEYAIAGLKDTTVDKLIIGKLPMILGPRNYHEIASKKPHHFYRDENGDTFNLRSVEEDLLTNVIHAPRVSWKFLMEVDNTAEAVLQTLLDKTEDNVTVSDITDEFYDFTGKKPTLKATFSSATKTLHVPITFALPDSCTVQSGLKTAKGSVSGSLPLTVGVDIPDRNTFNASAAEGCKVKLVTVCESKFDDTAGFKGNRTYRYYIVLQRDPEHCLGWCAPARNKLFISFKR